MDNVKDIFDKMSSNAQKLKMYKDLASGKLPADTSKPAPKPAESAPDNFRDIPDAGLKGTVQAAVFGKGKLPPPNDVFKTKTQMQPSPQSEGKGPNATMAKQGTAPNLSTEGTWGAPPGQARWSK
jgi:hypothetical protein